MALKSEADRGFLLLARASEWLGIILTFTMPILVIGNIQHDIEGPASWAMVAFAAFVGYLGADFLSGVVHWAGDRWGSEETFMLGPTIVKPFREHHVDEKAITRHGFVETNGNNCMGTTVILVFSLLLPEEGFLGLFCRTGAVSLSFGLFATNQFHKWSHLDTPPLPIRVLQRLHLILPVEHHAIHHRAPFDCYYCITTGWLNPLLQRIRFFEFLETSIERLTGVPPYRDPADIVAATAQA
jgi:ubiquitin-conjugating enzyme E2 variant